MFSGDMNGSDLLVTVVGFSSHHLPLYHSKSWSWYKIANIKVDHIKTTYCELHQVFANSRIGIRRIAKHLIINFP